MINADASRGLRLSPTLLLNHFRDLESKLGLYQQFFSIWEPDVGKDTAAYFDRFRIARWTS
jgi:hypothetical protein